MIDSIRNRKQNDGWVLWGVEATDNSNEPYVPTNVPAENRTLYRSINKIQKELNDAYAGRGLSRKDKDNANKKTFTELVNDLLSGVNEDTLKIRKCIEFLNAQYKIDSVFVDSLVKDSARTAMRMSIIAMEDSLNTMITRINGQLAQDPNPLGSAATQVGGMLDGVIDALGGDDYATEPESFYKKARTEAEKSNKDADFNQIGKDAAKLDSLLKVMWKQYFVCHVPLARRNVSCA